MATTKSIYTFITDKIAELGYTLTSKELIAFRELEKYLISNDKAPFMERDIYNAITLMDFTSAICKDSKNKYIVELEMLMKINRVSRTQYKRLYKLAFNSRLAALDSKVTETATKELEIFLSRLGLPSEKDLLAIEVLEYHISNKTSKDTITKVRQEILAELKANQKEKRKLEQQLELNKKIMEENLKQLDKVTKQARKETKNPAKPEIENYDKEIEKILEKATKERDEMLGKIHIESKESLKEEVEEILEKATKERDGMLEKIHIESKESLKEKGRQEALTLEEEKTSEQLRLKEEKKKARKKQKEHDKKANPTFKQKKGSQAEGQLPIESTSLLDNTEQQVEQSTTQTILFNEKLDEIKDNTEKDKQVPSPNQPSNNTRQYDITKNILSTPLLGTLSLNIGLMNLIKKQLGAQNRQKESKSEKAFAALRTATDTKEYNSVVHGVRYNAIKGYHQENSYESLVNTLTPSIRSIGNLTSRSTKVLEEKLNNATITPGSVHLHAIAESLELLSTINLLDTDLTGEKDLDKEIIKSEIEIIIENLNNIKDYL